ncbi:MAG: serine/threonine-protein kinase PknK, partial [Chloroflexales bacterium]|nr:serine/threonine-protein kinase PknK [Chloroflexales bacterium]
MPAGARLGPQDRYEIKRFLGKGGFGEAYLALDRQLQRECVIKRPWASDGSSETLQQKLRDRFRHEAQLLVRANTPGDPRIPDIYEYLEESGCLVMKYVVGSSLADLLRLQKRPFPLERALRYALEVCKALVYLHTHGPEPLLHRDIKPDNILLDERERLWLIDFGIGRVLLLPPQAGDAPSQGFGTLGYAPPEQWQGNAVPRSDVYALGATLFNLLTRAPPGMWYASPEQWHDKIPADVIRLLERCLSFEVDARPSVPELAEALTALIEPAARQMPPPPLPLLPPARDLVGRGLELEALAERLERHGAAVLTGMAGMGKTTVATALAHQLAHNRPVFWHSFHEDEPIDPILERLAAFLDHHGQPQLQRARQNQPRLAPELQFDTLVTLLRRRPAVLCCDDVHLVEKDTHIGALLRRLLAEADRGQLQVLIISRHLPTFAPAGTAVPLPGLRREEARALLASHRLSLAEPLADQLLAITEGNAQLLILAIGALLTSDDHRTLIEHLADTRDVATFLLDAIDVHLNDAEREVMCAVAALGDYPGTRDAITKLVKRGDCWRELDELSRRFLLHQRVGPRGAEYGQHAIVQAYYYKRLGTQRKALHQSAAVFYEREERD